MMALLLPAPRTIRAALLINEFLPDPEGSDSGREFVELLNTGPSPIDLAGICLDFGNGAVANSWQQRWCCESSRQLGVGQRYLLVDRNWTGETPGQVEVYLGLQNGPDAIRLRREEQILDLVGYGALTDSSMLEGVPVVMHPGLSLARRPDGQDTQNNARDFVSTAPTPGRPNFFPHALTLLEMSWNPPCLDRAGGAVTLDVRLGNSGTESIPPGPLDLVGLGPPVSSFLDLGPSDGTAWFQFQVRPEDEGCFPAVLRHLVATTGDTLLVSLGSYQVGPGPLVLNEVLAPSRGRPGGVDRTGQ
jgi:hypothetical protein